jgi:hypothetical protein
MTLIPKPFGAGPFGADPYGYQRVQTELGGRCTIPFGARGVVERTFSFAGDVTIDFGAVGALGQLWQPVAPCSPGNWVKVSCG